MIRRAPWIASCAVAACGVAALIAWITPATRLAGALAHPALGESGAAMAMESAASLRLVVPCAMAVVAAVIIALTRGERGAVCSTREAASARWERVALALVVLFAVLMRIDRVVESLWYDELAAFMDYTQHGPGPIVATAFSQANHPLQSLLSWCSTALMGQVNEFTLRVPSAIAGVAAVVASWWLGRRVGGPAVGIATAAGVAIAPAAVLAGVEARGYAFMLLAGALLPALALTLESRERRGERTGPLWMLYALVSALGVWAHFVTVLLPLAHGLIAAARFAAGDRRLGARWLMALVASGAITIALVSPMIPWLLATRAEYAALDGNEPTLVSAEGLAMLGTWGGAWLWWPSLCGAALAIVGASAMARAGSAQRWTLTLLVLPFGLGLLVPLLGSWMYARFVASCLPAAAVLWASGAVWCFSRSRPAACALAGATITGWLVLLVGLPPKQPLRDALVALASTEGAVVVVGLPDQVARYYAEPLGVRARHTAAYGADLEGHLRAEPGARVLVLYPDAMPEQVAANLRALGYARTQRREGWADWGKGSIDVYERPAATR